MFNKVFAETENGWSKENGKWYYYRNGTILKDCYSWIDGEGYCFNKDGSMVDTIGWFKCKSSSYSSLEKWFYIGKTSGQCVRGWQKSKEKWYYLSPEMYSNGGYNLGKNGEVYIFNKDGDMVEKTENNDKWYCIKQDDGTENWYYLTGKGENTIAKTGWLYLKNKWYYCVSHSGLMYSGRSSNGL